MGQIINAKAEARQKQKSKNLDEQRKGKDAIRFLNTFFIDRIQVIVKDDGQEATTRLTDLINDLVAQNNLRSTSSTGSVRVPKLFKSSKWFKNKNY